MNARLLQRLVLGGLLASSAIAGRVLVPAAQAGVVADQNLGRSCLDVNSFGADRLGMADSTPAFQFAFAAASLSNGVAVCAPAGTYKIDEQILLYSSPRSGAGGFSLYGDGPGVTVLLNDTENSTSYMFSSCPDYANVTPSMPSPSPSCPAVSPYGGGATPNPGAGLAGVTFANFSIDAEPASGGPPLAPGTSVFYFPSVHGLLVSNVSFTGSPMNIFDFGERIPNSFSGIVIRDNTVQSNFYGHYVALHGGGSGVIVENSEIRGNESYPQLGTGVMFDTSDVVSQTISDIHFRNNDFEGPFIGNFLFLPASTSLGAAPTLISNAEWVGNVYDKCAFACYYFGAERGQAPAPSLSNMRLSDRWAISDYDAIYLDGGFYPNTGASAGGVQGIKVGGPSLYGSDNTRKVRQATPEPSGGSIFMIEVPNPQVTVAPYSAIAVEFTSGSTVTVTFAVGSSPSTVYDVAAGIAFNLRNVYPVLYAQAAQLANPGYGLVGINLQQGVLSAGSAPIPYTVVTSGNLRPVNAGPTMCPLPPPLPPGNGPCVSGEIDIGDGIAFRNSAHDIDIKGVRVESLQGAAVHIWPGGGNAFRISNNILGENHGVNSVVALQLDPDPAFSGNPSDYHVEQNDLVGATPIVAPLPTPSFQTNGAAPVMRNNRGALGVIVGPIITGTITTLTIQNAGPLDCTYYFSAWSGAFTTAVTLPGGAMQAFPSGKPASALVPVGAILTASASPSGSVTYLGLCQP